MSPALVGLLYLLPAHDLEAPGDWVKAVLLVTAPPAPRPVLDWLRECHGSPRVYTRALVLAWLTGPKGQSVFPDNGPYASDLTRTATMNARIDEARLRLWGGR